MTRSSIIVSLVFVSLSALCIGLPTISAQNSQEKENEYMKLIASADSAINQENYTIAINLFRDAMRLLPGNPNNILLLSNVGMLHYYLGNDSIALETLNMAHDMAPSSVTVLMNRARVNNGTGRYSEALKDYTLVAEMDTTLAEPLIQKGLLQLRGGDVRGAEASLAKAAEIDDKSNEILVSYALLYSKTARPKEAIPYLNKLIKKDPQSEYYVERAMCRIRIDDLAGASDDIGRGLELDPDNADLYLARALLNKRWFREQDSKADAAKAIALGADPQLVHAYGL